MYLKPILFFCLVSVFTNTSAQYKDCKATLEVDTLTVSNSLTEQKWVWNKGDLKLFSMYDKTTGELVVFNQKPSFFRTGDIKFTSNVEFRVRQVEKNTVFPAHLEVLIINQYEEFQFKRIFRVFPETPAIALETYLKYKYLSTADNKQSMRVDGSEKELIAPITGKNFFLATLPLNTRHWKLNTVAFQDVTDVNNNLVSEMEMIPYRAQRMHGVLLFANDLISGKNFFLFKESPNKTSQVNYPGFDYEVTNLEIKVPFSGFPNASNGEDWIQGYTLTMGVAHSRCDSEMALRQYLKKSINYDPAYEMVMMNTWGDRGQDGKISERFILKELEAASKLGISHFQIDDGWQQGLSANSSNKAGRLWDAWQPEHWTLNKERFPNGWDKILQSAKEKNIQLGLWFHPSNENSYARWETDADVIIGLYRKTNVSYYKIDGVKTADKQAEINLAKFFDKVKQATNGAVFFNLDLTAGVRGGYFMNRSIGNLFLENRYTDWENYYPYHTLRNLWQLSRYFPPELLQIEFLNKWRNADKYPSGDVFAPSKYDFDYLFAITMAAQPLAWFESTGLPENALKDPDLINKYRNHQCDFHAGQVYPIGDEPSGRSWTGFQSVGNKMGYFIILRELNNENSRTVKTRLHEGCKVKLEAQFGHQFRAKIITVGKEGTVLFELPEENSFSFIKYTIISDIQY